MKITELLRKRFHELVLAGLSLAYFVYNYLLFNNLALKDYPYLHQDLWKRLGDSLYYLGQFTSPYMHPPLPSLIYSGFINAGNTNFYVVNVIFFLIGLWGVFAVVGKVMKSRNYGLLAGLLYFFDFYNILYSIQYGLVDMWCVAMIIWTIYFFLQFLEKRSVKLAVLIGCIVGLATLIQYGGLFVLPIMGLILIWKKILTLNFRNKTNINSLPMFVIPLIALALFYVFKQIAFGSFGYTKVEHFGFIDPTQAPQGIVFYLWYTIVYFTVPVVILSILGLVSYLREKNRAKEPFYVVLLILPYLFFFAILYGWHDIRFVSYFILPVYIFATLGIKSLFEGALKRNLRLIVLLVIPVLIYSNFTNSGIESILLANSRLTADIGFFQNEGTGKVDLVGYKEKPEPYFLYMIDYNRHYNFDMALNYFNEKVNLKYSIEISEKVKKAEELCNLNEIGIVLQDEVYVRNMQLNYLLKCDINAYDVKANTDSKTRPLYFRKKVIISDFPLGREVVNGVIIGDSFYHQAYHNEVFYLYFED